MEVIGGDAAARTAAAALAVERDHHARPAPALHEPRRHDSHHAGVPVLPRHHDRALVRLRRAGRLGGEQDAGLRLLAVAVQEVELARHLAGAGVVVREQQLESGVGALHAAGGVDARPEPEAERVLGQLRGRHATDLHQRAQAGPAGAPERHEPLAHDAPVLAAQRHQVADRGERREVDVLGRLGRVAAGGGEQRLAQLQHDARGAQLRAAVVAERRVDDGAVGQLVAWAMVIGDHHVEPCGSGRGHLLDGSDAAVDRDEQLHPAARQPLDRRPGEAVALVEAARQLPHGIGAERAKGPEQHRGGADAVHVVVAEHGDL